jgi:hypothetical protein
MYQWRPEGSCEQTCVGAPRPSRLAALHDGRDELAGLLREVPRLSGVALAAVVACRGDKCMRVVSARRQKGDSSRATVAIRR